MDNLGLKFDHKVFAAVLKISVVVTRAPLLTGGAEIPSFKMGH